MLRATLFLCGLVCFSSPAPCQTPASDTQTHTMEAVLSEIRQLRQDLQAAAVATRKAQIVIYRLHVQQNAVEQATSRLDNVKMEIAQIENQKRYQTEQIKRFKEMKERAENEEQKQQLEGNIAAFESNLQDWEPRQQELQTQQIELEADLRTEQAKLARLDEELDRLENALETAALQANARRQQN